MEVIVGTKVIIRAVKQRRNLYYVQGSTVYAEVFAVSSKEEIFTALAPSIGPYERKRFGSAAPKSFAARFGDLQFGVLRALCVWETQT